MLTHTQPASAAPARLVVLGAGGFVGKEVMRAATAKNISVLPLSTKDIDLSQPDATTKLAALLKPDDAVVFAAAIDKGNQSTQDDVAKNIAMAQHVAQAAKQVGVAHIIYLSSEAVYGDRAGLVRESTKPTPNTLYGNMHIAREELLAATGMPLAVLRLSGIYGAGDTHNAYGPNRFMREALKTKTITLFGGGEEARDHLHVADAAQLILRVAARRSTGLLNLASGHATSFAEIAEAIAKQTHASIANTPRKQPILHRHIDPTARLMAFCGFVPAPVTAKIGALAPEYAATI